MFERWKLFSWWFVILNEWDVTFSSLISISLVSLPVVVNLRGAIPLLNGFWFTNGSVGFELLEELSYFCKADGAYDFATDRFGVVIKFSVDEPLSLSVANVDAWLLSTLSGFYYSFNNSL